MAYDKEVWRSTVTNGQIPAAQLNQIVPFQFDPDLNGPALLHPEAAAAMGTLLRQAWEDGVTELRVKYSYRTIAKQWEKWHNFQNGGNLAAFPGTSNHGWAVAVDFTGLTTRALSWLKANARRYGFINDVDSENWHYTYQEHVWNGDTMTDAQKAQLSAATAALRGVKDFLNEKDPPEDAAQERKEMFNALTRASRRPQPAEHDHGRHVHGEDVPVEVA